MPTFVEDVQSIGDENGAELARRLGDRVETLGEALSLLEDWTEESRETRTELTSKYESAKDLARDEIRDASEGNSGSDPDDIPTEDLLDHPAVSEHTKQRLAEYSTKLYVYLDEESAYGEARTELARALDAELGLYGDLLPALDRGAVSVRDAQQQIARLAREQDLGPANQTAADVLLESAVEEE